MAVDPLMVAKQKCAKTESLAALFLYRIRRGIQPSMSRVLLIGMFNVSERYCPYRVLPGLKTWQRFWRPTSDVRRLTPKKRLPFLCLLTSVLLSACQQSPEVLHYSGATMGTTYHVSIVPANGVVDNDLAERIQERLDRLDGLMSTYKPDSELNHLSALGAGAMVTVAPELAEVLAVSSQVYQITDGAFDPTVGPLVALWGFGSANTGDQVPADADIDTALQETGFHHLELDGTHVKKRAPVHLDLSAVAKGYAADSVSALLNSLGLVNHLVEIGGELRLSGRKSNGDAWQIGIEAPQLARTGNAQAVIQLTDVGVATSGDYRNYFERDGVRYSHTINPRTGRPIEHALASVTVVAENAATADALATGFMVLGAENTLAIAQQRHIPVYLLVKQGDGFVARHSPAFTPYLR